ncbi:bifunctional DNA-formamidopyrimidine glycosylase/DNA-(apurinic or apyrimidinic site) lyase [Thauera aromatica]|uniref:bifunctional DNA-formamidopyrimidine glycosylase/DNA-(apurinic or apyrimidinic site) lyase n=1 Tax=Thauera aromatica TaxID=59405 RepID=UPI001FFD243D|nr:bifunctional DNA-formamidopyrimidine glycosylase/DNA-(apurinic or apyrimidinic site) lyase [Thauera aromatica]MCK2089833.1 bifunctional DNA-formamidopyrimidine glycosylase/DNA-(apurinic or apyrimidinic site) lyase [Thauera aromatica]MCK2127191.1 bifunctional DNA-formamidopyrimidine glycosylase/DNA-(apurinic or apyrimidinic site) lyase [Thauera aromatica]
MPELPEVETTCSGIRPHLEGRMLDALVVRNPRLRQPLPADLDRRLVGRRLLAVRRRAKYLLFDFGDGTLIVHLGMSGSLRLVPAGMPPGAHDHVDFVFGGQALRLRDPRRFGLVLWQPGVAALHPLLAGLGPEPLSAAFDGAWLHRVTRGLRAPIKHVLMDGRRVVGVGNIYASESLFRARIHPLEPAGRLGPQRCARLVAAVRETLCAAIAAGGSTLRDFVGGDGRPGYFQQQYAVYGRGGEPCPQCGAAIHRVVSGQRATFFCPHCQRQRGAGAHEKGGPKPA